MSARETRILVLGGVRLFEPLNGYQLRRELLSWGVEQWASVRPGSIYSMLRSLTKDGCIERHEVVDEGRPVSIYTMTDRGHETLGELLRDALVEPLVLQYLPFQAAYCFVPILTREEFLTYARARRDTIARQTPEAEAGMAEAVEAGQVPPHVARLHDLWRAFVAEEQAWLDGLIADVEAGALAFAGEARIWTPPPDDPGWQLHADRERYRRLLGRDS